MTSRQKKAMQRVGRVSRLEATASRTVLQLVEDIGFEAVDAGKLEVARLIEPFGMTWIHLAFKQGLGRDWAFQIVRR